MVVAEENVPSDSLAAVRGVLPWREERKVEGDMDDWGGGQGGRGRENVSILLSLSETSCSIHNAQNTKLHKDAQTTS